MPKPVRLGVIGAGGFSQSTVLPNFKKLPDVEVAVVCNRTEESAQRVAKQFDIPQATTDYLRILHRDDIDAVFVGTPPYFHREAVLAALDAGKHVLCQTRMAEDSQQAREMFQAAQGSGLQTMLCRPDSFVKGDKFIRHLLSTDYVGRIHQVLAYRILPNFVDSKAPLGRRQNIKFFGPINPMHIGFYWDILGPWFGEAKRVQASAATFTPEREEYPGGPRVKVELPDSVTAIAEMKSGAVVMNLQLWAARFGASRIEIYGEDGTLVYFQKGDLIMGGREGDEDLKPLPIPDDMVETWHVEEDFVKAVRGEIDDPRPSFLDGVRNMEYLEAVHRSVTEGRWVDLPS
jgi:predicted dehydrogenase